MADGTKTDQPKTDQPKADASPKATKTDLPDVQDRAIGHRHSTSDNRLFEVIEREGKKVWQEVKREK